MRGWKVMVEAFELEAVVADVGDIDQAQKTRPLQTGLFGRQTAVLTAVLIYQFPRRPFIR